MLEEDRYCIDVLMQIAAARAALSKAGRVLLESHLETCVTQAFDSHDDQDRRQKMEELLNVFSRHSSM